MRLEGDWQTCGKDAFSFYKVVRSHGENPSYLPWTDGSEVQAVIENQSTSVFETDHLESGDTWFYRVQCIGYWTGQKVLLGQTEAVKVEVP